MSFEYGAAIFDLDGTLTDSAPGITASIAYALDRHGVPRPAPARLARCVGPPLRETFADLAGSDDPVRIAALISAYRERFATVGLFENAVYPGVGQLLADLRQAGLALAVATAKPGVYARRILRHFGLADAFTAVVGSYLDGRRSDKPALVGEALRRLGRPGASAAVIGDRRQDVSGAKAWGAAAVGALWGYGGAEELTAAGADCLCADPDAVRRFLLRA